MSFTNLAETIAQCRAAGGAGSKKVIAGILENATEPTRQAISAALDPYRTFGIKQIQMPTSFGNSEDASTFFDMLTKLETREVTGNQARALVTSVLATYTKEVAETLSDILVKTLRSGFSAETANKIWSKKYGAAFIAIPSFDVMLADKFADGDDPEEKLSFSCFADWKIDGQRNVAIVRRDQKSVEYRARSGKESEHLNGLFDEELLQFAGYIGDDIVVDGEVFGDDFATTINAKSSDNDEAKSKLKFFAFFVMPLKDWIAQKTSITMEKSRDLITDFIKTCEAKKISQPGGRLVMDLLDMQAFCAEVTTPGFQNMPKGHEGLILKDRYATYQWSRGLVWVKVKNFYEADARIVGFYPGKPGSRLSETLGGLHIYGILEDGTEFECDVGSGFSDALRNEIWQNREKYLGRTAVIKYQEVSKARNASISALRFLTFMSFRDDKEV